MAITITAPAGVSTVTTGYDAARATLVRMGNLTAQISSGGVPQLSAFAGSSQAFHWNWIETVNGQAINSGNQTSGSLSAGSWTNVGNSHALTSGGDTITAVVHDITNKHIYRVTYLQTVTSGHGTVTIEKIV